MPVPSVYVHTLVWMVNNFYKWANDSLPHPEGSLKSGLPQFLPPDSRPERRAGTALQVSFGSATCPAVIHPSQVSLDKAMATHSSTFAWKILWMEGPGGLQSMGSLGVRHNWATSLSLFTFLHWRRKWQPTPVFLPGESQGRVSLVGCHLWGCTESDTTEVI